MRSRISFGSGKEERALQERRTVYSTVRIDDVFEKQLTGQCCQHSGHLERAPMRFLQFKRLCFFLLVVAAFTTVPNIYRGSIYLLHKYLK